MNRSRQQGIRLPLPAAGKNLRTTSRVDWKPEAKLASPPYIH
ncbi:MAG TPA: hypothetical protein VKQ11_18695 [Candidatus Sulfotelmatobacter sp.]|nr:hypothetical protein [Candidatus Sulfotelmatobacter sp.]